MRKNFRNKCVAFMVFASVLGNKTSAMDSNKNQVKSPQTLGAVGGARNQTKKIAEIVGFSVAGLATLEVIHSILGGFTDLGIGKGSIGRLIKNHVKNNQPGPGEQDDENSKKKDDQRDPKHKKTERNFDIINEKLKNVKVGNEFKKYKDLMLRTFEYVGEKIKKCPLKDFRNIDIFDYRCEDHDVVNEELLNIFSGKGQISNIVVDFKEMNRFEIKFYYNGKGRKIILFDLGSETEFDYFASVDDDVEVFYYRIGYGELDLQSDNKNNE